VRNPKLPALVWALCVVAALVSIFALGPSGSRVATHFGPAGGANGWMTPLAYRVSFTFFTVGYSSFIIAICYALRFFPASSLNVPNSDFWRAPENYTLACRFLFQSSFWFGALSALWAAALNFLVVRANRSNPPHFGLAGILVLTTVYLGITVVWIFSLVGYFRRPIQGDRIRSALGEG